MSQIKTIGIVGAGQMGNGIAHVFAQYGFQVVLVDISQAQLDKAKKTIETNLDRQISKGATLDKSKILSDISFATEMSHISFCDYVIEAATESEPIKKTIFEQIQKHLSPAAYLASNTSSISITRLASYTDRPDRFIGMHFMNPVPLMKLVEVIRGLLTSQETLSITLDLIQKLEKTAASAQDFPGFIVNRILMPMINEAVFALMEGVGTADAIDTGMKLGTNQPMGPLALADLIGLDTCAAIMRVLHTELGDSKYRPCPLLIKYVEAGWLGRKTGKGFFNYKAD